MVGAEPALRDVAPLVLPLRQRRRGYGEIRVQLHGIRRLGRQSDKLLSDAYSETDPEKRSKKYAKAMEKIYLDMPYMLRDYEKYRWPVNSKKFDGFVENIVDPGYANWITSTVASTSKRT
ncbi:hypothetical protein [Haladaptatus sp. W1]|uniref:hypothetical protein n=1 Tax=Haladaptatus sp. W1 TaxID=1897478 RepID=UPI0020C79214|nr:hypothetical protein [Haladaptatus sp. W1]